MTSFFHFFPFSDFLVDLSVGPNPPQLTMPHRGGSHMLVFVLIRCQSGISAHCYQFVEYSGFLRFERKIVVFKI
jgi:hypothetical protein